LTLDFGLMFSFRNPPFRRVPWDDLYASELALTVDAERLGYDHVWLTEHHFVDDGYSPSLLPIAAAIAAQTERIRIGTFVLLLPLHDPVRVAEDAATVDIVSRGRFDLGMGLGYRVAEFTSMNVPREERGARLQEGAQLIQRLFTERNVSLEGRFRTVRNATLMPPPVQQPHPPIWLAARGPAALDRAARLGFHLAAVGLPQHQAAYDEALRRHGRDPRDFHVAQLRAVYVAPTREQAWAECADGFHHMLACYAQWFGEAGDLSADRGDGRPLPSAADLRRAQSADFFGEPAIIGTPDDAVAAIRDYEKRTRATHLVMGMAMPGVEPAKTRASMELFAREVMPKLR
jgi:alkanesulfonate monooxygenase SsuD/methylene tetrahydromethanopterin reductase-like flavin-dependent oxidoreductase (luciferase family)